MRYSYKDLKIRLNNIDILVNNANLNIVYPTEYYKEIGDKYSNKTFNNTPNIASTLSLSYYLQRNDFLKYYISNDNLINCYFAGINLYSGYLKSYNLSLEENSPILIDATLLFWSKPEGFITGIESSILNNLSFLQSSDIVINSISEEWLPYNVDIKKLSYNYEADIIPQNLIKSFDNINNGGQNPDEIIFRDKNVNIEIEGSFWATTGSFNLLGNKIIGKINFVDTQSPIFTDSLLINGNIINFSNEIQSKNSASSKISVQQNIFQNPPIIYGSSSQPFNTNNLVYVQCTNLTKVLEVKLNNKNIEYSILGDNLFFETPADSVSGKLFIKTEGGEISSGVNILPKNMTIERIIPYTGYSGQNILITGSNFYDISNIYFGSKDCNKFEVVSNNLIYAEVPFNASYNYIQISSIFRGKTASSPEKFVSLPIITNFNPQYVDNGDLITISGRNFNSVTGVYINKINSAFTLVNDYKITATVPNGLIYGGISLYAQSGLVSNSSFFLKPNVKITGFSPNIVQEGDTLIISGKNFDVSYMYEYSEENKYAVLFQKNKLGKFSIINSTTLQGFVPTDMIAGGVYILDQDGASIYPSGKNISKKITVPVIESLNNTIAYSGLPFYTTIVGENLEFVSGIWLNSVNLATPVKFIISGTNFYKDLDGFKIDLVNYIPLGLNITGAYDLSVVSTGNIYGVAPVNYRIKLK